MRALALAAALLCLSSVAAAHFQEFMARVVHVVPRGNSVQVYAQMPLALVLLPHDWQTGGKQPAPPFLRDADGRLWVDGPALRADPTQLRKRFATALSLDTGAGVLQGARVDTLTERDPFTYLPDVERYVGRGLALPADAPLELADAVVSVWLSFPRPAPGAPVALAGKRDEWPTLAEAAVNIVRVHRADASGGGHQSIGVLAVTLDPFDDAAVHAVSPDFVGFVRAGFEHVLAGLDHVLFILVLVLGATGPAHFARTSLAFTLGHSITLCAGALGGLIALAWFAPLVEMAIAASILYAGVRILVDRNQPMLAPTVFCVGLVHGFGFSFALEGLAPALSGSFIGLLVGFNLGIEAGQIALSLLAAPLLYLLRRYWFSPRIRCAQALVVPCIVVAAFWLLERSVLLFQALS